MEAPSHVNLPIDPGEAIVVVGAPATKPADRSLERHEIHPVQVFTSDGFEPVPALDCGEFGMSALVIRAEAGVSRTARRATTCSASTSRTARSPISAST